MAVTVAVLGEALAALFALIGLLVEVHANVVLPIANFRELVLALEAGQDLIQTPCLGVQLIGLRKHLPHALGLALG